MTVTAQTTFGQFTIGGESLCTIAIANTTAVSPNCAGGSDGTLTVTATCGSCTNGASDIRYSIGTTAQTASASTSHFIANGERLDMGLPLGAQIAVIRAAGVSGTLELSELL